MPFQRESTIITCSRCGDIYSRAGVFVSNTLYYFRFGESRVCRVLNERITSTSINLCDCLCRFEKSVVGAWYTHSYIHTAAVPESPILLTWVPLCGVV